MTYLRPYRIATYLLVLFCVGHTAGGMFPKKSFGLEADSVFAAMKAVHFDFNGSDSTWYGFWFAFGLTCSVFLLFSAVVAWTLDGIEPSQWASVSPVAWTLFASHGIATVLDWRYFFVGPGLLSTAVFVLLGVGAVLKGRAAPAAAGPPR